VRTGQFSVWCDNVRLWGRDTSSLCHLWFTYAAESRDDYPIFVNIFKKNSYAGGKKTAETFWRRLWYLSNINGTWQKQTKQVFFHIIALVSKQNEMPILLWYLTAPRKRSTVYNHIVSPCRFHVTYAILVTFNMHPQCYPSP